MAQWNSEQLQQMLGEHDPDRLFLQAVEQVRALGMEFIGLATHMHYAGKPPKVSFKSNYPAEWHHAYEHEFMNYDPAACECRKTTLPLLWNDDLFKEAPQLRESACGHGLRHGWTQSLFDQLHNESQLSVARPDGQIRPIELYENGAQIMWLCQVLHAAVSEQHMASEEHYAPLSKRELEVMKWSSEGKIAEDVAKILSLSTSTVNFHIRSVIAKTNTSNKVAAIVNVFRQGLL